MESEPAGILNSPPARNVLFSTETLIAHRCMKPDFSHSENLSSKTEGEDDGSFSALAAELANFSLLDSAAVVLQKEYLSPFSQNALRNYIFTEQDTILSSGDTLCKITFSPRAEKRFNGLFGTVVINPDYFVIQEINAQSTRNSSQEPLLTIHQKFEVNQGIGLPSEKKITLSFSPKHLKGEPNIDKTVPLSGSLIAESQVRIYQIKINPPLLADDFKNGGQVSLKNDHKTVISPENHTYIPFNQSDSLSRMIADSAVLVEIKNQQTKLIRFITEGKIPLGKFNIDYNRIFGYNIFEGLKLGLGGETNRLLSKNFTAGGYISYGIKDGSIRNGEWINFYPSNSSDLRFHVAYKDINMELGEPEFLETKTLLSPESYRYLLIENMYATKRYSTGVEYRLFKEFNYYLFGDLSENHSNLNTPFLLEHAFSPVQLARTGLQLRFTPGIVLQMEDGRKKEMNIPKSDYYLTIIQGFTIITGEYQYTKMEFKGKFNLPNSGIGTTTIVFRGGIMSQGAPIIELFSGYGSNAGTFSLAAPFSFGTMELNEFSATGYGAIHLRHDFSTWLFPANFKTRPTLIFAQNTGFGRLTKQQTAQYNLKDYHKGYYESGFEVNNLLRMNYLSWGLGIYYRYGPYQLTSMHDNFAYKFGFFFKL